MPGIHLEGPCLSPAKPGVHPTHYLQPLNMEVLTELIAPAVKLITVAPELDPSGECLKLLQRSNVVISLGHSNATYDEARLAFNRGVALITHTFNALPPIHHRSPGAITAALLDDRVSCCVIADGLHLAPPAVDLIFKTKGYGRSILVT